MGEYELLSMVKKLIESKVVWPHLKVFWLCKDLPTGYSEWKNKRRQEMKRKY